MVDVTTHITISRPLEDVATYASNPDNATEWYVNITSVQWETPRPVALGSRMAFRAKFLGRKLSYVYEVVELIPGEKFVMRTANGPFPMETIYLWKALNSETTEMTLRNRGNPAGFAALGAPLMSWAMRRANEKDLKLLKSILEAD